MPIGVREGRQRRAHRRQRGCGRRVSGTIRERWHDPAGLSDELRVGIVVEQRDGYFCKYIDFIFTVNATVDLTRIASAIKLPTSQTTRTIFVTHPASFPRHRLVISRCQLI